MRAMMEPCSPAVLIVEDEALVRMMAVDVLSGLCVPIYEAADAEEALRALEEHPQIGVLFTDINMPGVMDGMALAFRVHEMRPQVGVVVTSGRHRLGDADLPDEGRFLAKPYGSQQLLDAVRYQLCRCASRVDPRTPPLDTGSIAES